MAVSGTYDNQAEQRVTPVPGQAPQKVYAQKKAIFRTYQIIWYIWGVVMLLILFRTVLRALAANPNAGFTNFIYSLSYPFVAPFFGILGTNQLSGAVFEWSNLVAMAVYTVLAYGIVKLFQIIKPATPEEVESKVDTV